MRILSNLIIASIVSASLTATAFAEWPIKEMNTQIDQTNVLINDNCSGTLIDSEKGYVLTANHCIEGQFEIVERDNIDSDGVVKKEKVRIAKPGTFSYLNFQDSNEVSRSVYVYKIVQSDKEKDLALVQTKAKLQSKTQAPIGCSEPIRGEKVYAVGNPYSVLYSSVTDGIISSTNRNYPMIRVTDQGDNRLMQSSAVIAGGSSGGALYNDSGKLIGVNVRGGVSGIALAVPLEDIRKLLRREGLQRLWDHCDKKDAK